MTSLDIVCAWCKVELKKGDDPEDDSISHGICPSCFHHFFDFEDEQSISAFIERIKTPVIVLNAKREVIAANSKVGDKGSPGNLVQGKRSPGKVVQCAYAELPEGCGNTPHCYGCELISAIEKTRETGAGVNRVEAMREVFDGTAIIEQKIFITSHLSGDTIYVMIEERDAETDLGES